MVPCPDSLRRVFLPELAKLRHGKCRHLHCRPSGLDTTAPVRETLKVRHGRTVPIAEGVMGTWIHLQCDRCLRSSTHHLHRTSQEVLWLLQPSPAHHHNPSPQGGSSLEVTDAHGPFDPEQWLYGQLCLALPRRTICSEADPAIHRTSTDVTSQAPRWQVLTTLNGQPR